MLIWLNGRLVESDRPVIRADDRGLLLGDGIFETLLAEDGRIACLDAHLARLEAGARVLGFAAPPGLAQALLDVLEANRLGDAALRLTLTRGPGPRGLLPPSTPAPTALITAASWRRPDGPARVVTGAIRRDEHSPLSRLKSLNYLGHILARQSDLAADEVLMKNRAGRIACASAANVFVFAEGEWITPPISDGALPGITRSSVLSRRLARVAPIPEAARIEAMALTSSLIGIRSVASLDGRALASVQLG